MKALSSIPTIKKKSESESDCHSQAGSLSVPPVVFSLKNIINKMAYPELHELTIASLLASPRSFISF